MSVSLNIPRFFELQLVYVNMTDNNNITREVWDLYPTPLRLNPDYIHYYIHWTRSLGTGLLPILFLLGTNTSIYLCLRRQNRRCLSHSARTLTAIVMMYAVCNIPRLLLNLAEYLYQSQLYGDYSECGCVSTVLWMEVTMSLSHLLLAINSSANFLIYWSVGERFKATLARQVRGIRANFGFSSSANKVDML